MDDEGLLQQCEEFLTYRNDSTEARNLIERLITENESAVATAASEYKTVEILREQLERARELINAIEGSLRSIMNATNRCSRGEYARINVRFGM